jgi:hypothetical protein
MSRGSAPQRPAVCVVVPFLGGRPAAVRLDAALARLDLGQGDELIVADNTAAGIATPLPKSAARVVAATAERSSYHARNAGARAAGNPWILFMDADCVPAPGLLDVYFGQPIDDRVGVLAGSILGDGGERTLLARYVRSRGFFDQSSGLHTHGGGAATANLLVRRAAYEAEGGFAEGIRSGGDVDLSWRLQAAGWKLERRVDAVVHHRHRGGLVPLLRAVARYGAGSRWLNDRRPGASPRWPLPRALAGAARDFISLSLRGRPEEACFRAIDGLGLIAHNVGYAASNAAPAGTRTEIDSRHGPDGGRHRPHGGHR